MSESQKTSIRQIKHFARQHVITVVVTVVGLIALGIILFATKEQPPALADLPYAAGQVRSISTDGTGVISGIVGVLNRNDTDTVEFYANGIYGSPAAVLLGTTTTGALTGLGTYKNFTFTIPANHAVRDGLYHSVAAYVLLAPNNRRRIQASDRTTGTFKAYPTLATLNDGCGRSDWSSIYGNARNTNASDGCVEGTLSDGGTYIPPNTYDYARRTGLTISPIGSGLVADAHNLWLDVAVFPILNNNHINAAEISSDSMKLVTYANGYGGPDANMGEWGNLRTLTNGSKVFVNTNDGAPGTIDRGNGTISVGSAGLAFYDWWGNSISNEVGYCGVNEMHADGPATSISCRAYTGGGFNMSDDGTSRVAMDGETVVAVHGAARQRTSLVARNIRTGTQLWSADTTGIAFDGSNVIIGDGKVYTVEMSITNPTSPTSYVAARNLSNGQLIWRTESQGGRVQGYFGNVLLTVSRGQVTGYNTTNGQRMWINENLSCWGNCPIAGGSRTILSENLKIYDLDSGVLLSSSSSNSGTPIIVGNNVFVNYGFGGIKKYISTSAVRRAVAAPVIATQPVNSTPHYNYPASFSVYAPGTGVSYQWKKNGVAIAGATKRGLTIPNATEADVATYTVVVTTSRGSVTSNPATLTIDYTPVITTQPATVSVLPGETATFRVVANGKSPLTYQWKKNGVAIAGATNASYSFTAAVADNNKIFTVVVSSSGRSITSNQAGLRVIVPPVITRQPVDLTCQAGRFVYFTAYATGYASIVWQKKIPSDNTFRTIPGAINTYYIVRPCTLSQNGTQFRAIFTNRAGSTTTNAATLTVR